MTADLAEVAEVAALVVSERQSRDRDAEAYAGEQAWLHDVNDHKEN